MTIGDAGAGPAEFDALMERLRTVRDEFGLQRGPVAPSAAVPSSPVTRPAPVAPRVERARGRRGFAWDLALLVTAWGGLVALVVLAVLSG